MSQSWTKQELREIVSNYFSMLMAEIRDEAYHKSVYRDSLMKKLSNRSKSAIEYKHQNISAVLIKYGRPYINGYKPYSNYQKQLEYTVLEYLETMPEMDDHFRYFADSEHELQPANIDFTNWVEDPPEFALASKPQSIRKRNIEKVDFLEIEQANKKIGRTGEEIVFNYERWRLMNEGKDSLAAKVEWISCEQGDGAGFDILSRNSNGTDRFIEVKSTKLGKMTPVFLSRNELEFSREKESNYFLYRVFQLRNSPKLFTTHGQLDSVLNLEPINYIGKF